MYLRYNQNSEQDKLSLLTLIFLHYVDDEPASSSSPRVAFDKKNDNRIYNNKLSRPVKRRNKMRQTDNRMEKDKDRASVGNRVDDSNWSLSADEDYIVFCFREDGAFDVIKDVKSVKPEPHCGLDLNSRNSRLMNRKVLLLLV